MTTLKPTGKPLYTTLETCKRKEWFRSEATAWHEVLKLRAERGYSSDLQPYHCEHCDRWHLGRRDGR